MGANCRDRNVLRLRQSHQAPSSERRRSKTPSSENTVKYIIPTPPGTCGPLYRSRFSSGSSAITTGSAALAAGQAGHAPNRPGAARSPANRCGPDKPTPRRRSEPTIPSCQSKCMVEVPGGPNYLSEQHADLIGHQCRHIGQRRHVGEREQRPAPTFRLASNDGQRRGALAHRAKNTMIDSATGTLKTGSSVPSCRAVAEPLDQAILIVPIRPRRDRRPDDKSRPAPHHHLARRKRSDRRTADPPIPAQRPDGRLDRMCRMRPKIALLADSRRRSGGRSRPARLRARRALGR